MTDALKLTNSKVSFEFDGKAYEVDRANLTKVIAFSQKTVELSKEKTVGLDERLAAFAIYLVLKDHIDGLTEEQVLEKCPAVELQEVLVILGFVSQQKMAVLQKMRDLLENSPEKKDEGTSQ